MPIRKLCRAAVISALATPALAAGEDCGTAMDRYRIALDSVRNAGRTYAACIEASRGTADCAAPFNALAAAQDEFEVSVAEIQAECRK